MSIEVLDKPVEVLYQPKFMMRIHAYRQEVGMSPEAARSPELAHSYTSIIDEGFGVEHIRGIVGGITKYDKRLRTETGRVGFKLPLSGLRKSIAVRRADRTVRSGLRQDKAVKQLIPYIAN